MMWPFLSTLGAAIVSALIFSTVGYEHGTKAIQAKWDAEKLSIITAKRTKEAELQSNMDTLRKAYTDETAKLATRVSTLTVSLRNRPERPAVPVSAPASAGDGASGCTGAELYRQDSEFLVSEAQRADVIRLALIQCQDAYRAAQH